MADTRSMWDSFRIWAKTRSDRHLAVFQAWLQGLVARQVHSFCRRLDRPFDDEFARDILQTTWHWLSQEEGADQILGLLAEGAADGQVAAYLGKTIRSLCWSAFNQEHGRDFRRLMDAVGRRLRALAADGTLQVFERAGQSRTQQCFHLPAPRPPTTPAREAEITSRVFAGISVTAEANPTAKTGRTTFRNLDLAVRALIERHPHRDRYWTTVLATTAINRRFRLTFQTVYLDEQVKGRGETACCRGDLIAAPPGREALDDACLVDWVAESLAEFRFRRDWQRQAQVAVLYYLAKYDAQALALLAIPPAWNGLLLDDEPATDQIMKILECSRGSVSIWRTACESFLLARLDLLPAALRGRGFVGFMKALVVDLPLPRGERSPRA
ncbi:MAG: hypothetical protein GX442_21105 [Candidatus Riflebacteria bacterium]|nr:hypothetical protein [Candidatus Riflebacteria bacterium]